MTQASRPAPRPARSGCDPQHRDPPLPAITYERHPGAASAPLPPTYRPRQPEKSVLYTVIREHLETFLAQARELHGEGYPRFIERELRRYLACGVLSRGFARLRCAECGYERLVGFSCKGRLCPSCVGRRMADTAAYLVDQLLPEAVYRQWVLTFPWTLRFRMAIDRKLFNALISAFLRTLFAWQRRRGRALGIRNGQTEALTLVQRYGGALNLHPHTHSLVPDGLFVPGAEDHLTFVPLPEPSTEQIEELTPKVARRLTAVVERLAVRDDGRILYHLRRPWPHPQGTTCLVLEPFGFLRRLAALIPAPYAHTTRYHGIFANRSRFSRPAGE